MRPIPYSLTVSSPFQFVVSLSSGVPSAVAGDLVLRRYGLENVTMLFADTLVEHKDNYRFLRDLMAYWGVPLVRVADGRTPLELADDKQLIPNQKHAPCTFELKIRPIKDYVTSLQETASPVMVIGMDQKDAKRGRLEAPRKNWGSIGVPVIYPIITEGIDPQEYVRDVMGLEPPAMYRMGYSHANCGGACVKQGKKDWRITLKELPNVYTVYEEWELKKHGESDHFQNYTFLRDWRGGQRKPFTLREFREEEETGKVPDRVAEFLEETSRTCGTECGVNADWEDFSP